MKLIVIALSCAIFFSCVHQSRTAPPRMTLTELPIALPHSAIVSIVDDIFYVMGSNVIIHEGARIQASRTMTIFREHGELTLINSIRMSDRGLRELEKLGTIKNVIRLGAFHGRDEAFYQQAYGATLWALPEMTKSHGENFDRDLRTDLLPLANARIIELTSTRFKEAVLLLNRAGGILITCDSVKNWEQQDEFFDDATFAMMKHAGSIGTAVIDKTWREAMNPSKADLDAIARERFDILVSAHGMPLIQNADVKVRASLKALYDCADAQCIIDN